MSDSHRSISRRSLPSPGRVGGDDWSRCQI